MRVEMPVCCPISSRGEGVSTFLPVKILPFPFVINTNLVGRHFDLFLLNTCLVRRLNLFFTIILLANSRVHQ